MHPESHLCAALPKYHVTVDLVECEHHAAWTLRFHAFTELGEELQDVVPSTAVDFGPFDDMNDVWNVIAELMRLAGV
jgi:hypothetical protein